VVNVGVGQPDRLERQAQRLRRGLDAVEVDAVAEEINIESMVDLLVGRALSVKP